MHSKNHNQSVRPKPAIETKLGQLFQMDCIPLMKSLEEGCVDLVFADPPFNLKKEYGPSSNDDKSEQEYLDWSHRWLTEAVRILKPGGSLFLYNIPKWNLQLGAWLSQYLTFRHWVAVDMKFSLPISGRLYPSHYSLLYFSKGKKPTRFSPPRVPIETCRHCGGEIPDYGGYKDRMNPEGVNITDVWRDLSPVRHFRYKRRKANELSIKMMDRVLDIASKEGDLVFDPFGGSGTTYITAELKGRKWIGSEIEDCMPIIERFKAIEGERAIWLSLRKKVNRLFSDEAMKLRQRNGKDNSKYRINGNGHNPLEKPLVLSAREKS